MPEIATADETLERIEEALGVRDALASLSDRRSFAMLPTTTCVCSCGSGASFSLTVRPKRARSRHRQGRAWCDAPRCRCRCIRSARAAGDARRGSAPSIQRRILFRHHDKDYLVASGNMFAIAGVGALALAIVCALVLVTDYLFGSPASWIIGLASLTSFVGLWHIQPRSGAAHIGTAASTGGPRGEGAHEGARRRSLPPLAQSNGSSGSSSPSRLVRPCTPISRDP